MLTEFDKDMKLLTNVIDDKNIEAYRIILNSMFHKMQTSNTRQYYKSRIDFLTVHKTGKHYDKLFIEGFGE